MLHRKKKQEIALFVVFGIILTGFFLMVVLSVGADAHTRYTRHHEDIYSDLAHCESTHGQGSANIFQFRLSTWRSMPERSGVPSTHTYEEQLESAQELVARSGWASFPGCSRAIGVR